MFVLLKAYFSFFLCEELNSNCFSTAIKGSIHVQNMKARQSIQFISLLYIYLDHTNLGISWFIKYNFLKNLVGSQETCFMN